MTYEVVQPDANYRGRSLGDWAAEWWQWMCAFDDDEGHPLKIKDGQYDGGDRDGPVVFLGGILDSNNGVIGIQRKIKIAPGKAIMFPAINAISSQAEKDGNTEEELREHVRESMDAVKSVQVKVDGVDIPNLWDFRVESRVFTLTLKSDNNILKDHGAKKGSGLAVSDGWFVLLKPLSVGNHTVYIRAYADPDPHHDESFLTEVTYRIEVEAEDA